MSTFDPLYRSVADRLVEEIDSGALQPHQRLPPERALSERFGISRMTARHALQTLVSEGYAYCRRRQGTFVEEPRIRFSVGSFTRTILASGRTPGGKVIDAATVAADATLARSLRIPSGASVHRIKRIRHVEGEAISLEDITLPAARFPAILDHDLSASLWDLLESLYGVTPTRAEARVSAIVLGHQEARLLDAATGEPAILLTRTIWDEGGRVIEVARDVYLAGRAEFSITLPIVV